MKKISSVLTVSFSVSAQVASHSEGTFSVGRNDISTPTGLSSKLYFKGINVETSMDDYG